MHDFVSDRALTKEEAAAKDSAIRQCKLSLTMKRVHTSTGEAYAYPHPDNMHISWGVNGSDGHCFARGKARR